MNSDGSKDVDIAKVEELASRGLTMKQIAASLGMGRSTLYRKVSEREDVRDALEKGRAQGLVDVTNALYQAAMSGNITAQIFYLKNRCPEEWQDRRDFTIENRPARGLGELSDEELLAIAGGPENATSGATNGSKPQ